MSLKYYLEQEENIQFVDYGYFNRSTKFDLGYLKRPDSDKLLHIIDNYALHKCFGHHVCELCHHLTDREKKVHNFGKYGNGEIWIKSSGDKVWRVPVMIHHYITMHCIKPKPEFLHDLQRHDII